MNYLLLFAIVGICIGAYYQETLLQQSQLQKITAEQKVSDMTDQYDKLLDKNRSLEADNAELEKALKDAKGQAADMAAKVETVEATQKGTKPGSARSVVPKIPSNNLGTFTTLDGKTFQNCQLLKVQSDGITFNHSGGITKVMFAVLPPDLQKRFGFDPHQGLTLTDTQVGFLETQRTAADQAQTAGN